MCANFFVHHIGDLPSGAVNGRCSYCQLPGYWRTDVPYSFNIVQSRFGTNLFFVSRSYDSFKQLRIGVRHQRCPEWYSSVCPPFDNYYYLLQTSVHVYFSSVHMQAFGCYELLTLGMLLYVTEEFYTGRRQCGILESMTIPQCGLKITRLVLSFVYICTIFS